MKKRLKINGVIIFLAMLIIVLFPELFFRSGAENLFNEALEVFGIALIFLGLLFRISARGYKSEHSRQGETLVSGGPYSLVRNPMYLGISLIALGIVLLVFQYWVLILFAIFFILMYLRLIFKEEKMLEGKFGPQYSQYQKKTPRFFPRPTGLMRNFPLKKAWFYKELSSIIPLAAAILFYKIWQMIQV